MKKLFSYFIIFALFSIFIPSGHAVTSMTLENTSLHIACPESPELEKEILSSLQSAYNSNHQTSLAEGDYSNQVKFPTSVDFSTAIHIYVDTGIESSKRQAREDVTNGAIRINGDRIQDLEFTIDPSAEFDGKFVIVRRGKKKYFLARVK